PLGKKENPPAAARNGARIGLPSSSLFRRFIMPSNWLHRWFSERTLSKRRQRRKARPRVRLELEHLENRVAPATCTCNRADGAHLWSNPGNWGEHHAPGATDPEKDDFIIFPASGDVVDFNPIDDIQDVQVMQIQILGGGYTFNPKV